MGVQYKTYVDLACKANPDCMDDKNGHMYDSENQANKHQVMCENSLLADHDLEHLAILGIGCPLPKPRYITPPEPPCWDNGDEHCPPPELEKCDMIIRQMENITRSIKLSSEHAKCFNVNLVAPTPDKKLTFYCVAKGVYDQAQANGKKLIKDITLEEGQGKIHYLGETKYYKRQGNGKPDYMHHIKERLRKLKEVGAAEEELDFWNSQNGIATKAGYTSETLTGSDISNGIADTVNSQGDTEYVN
jgi:hypothetical protein